MGLGQVVIQALRFLPVITNPALLCTHLHLHVAFASRTNGRSLGTFQKQCSSEIREHYTEKYFYKHKNSKLSPTAGAVCCYMGTQIKRTFPKHKPRESSYTFITELFYTQGNISNKYSLTYLLTSRCRFLPEQLTGLQLVKKFPAFHGTRMFITAITSVRQLSLSWVCPIQSIYPHPTSCRSILLQWYLG